MKWKHWKEKDLCSKGRHNGCSRCLPFTSYYSINRALLFQLAVQDSYTVRNNNQEVSPLKKNKDTMVVNAGRSENTFGIYFKGLQIWLFFNAFSVSCHFLWVHVVFWCLLYSFGQTYELNHWYDLGKTHHITWYWQRFSQFVLIYLFCAWKNGTDPVWVQRSVVNIKWYICCYQSRITSLRAYAEIW